MLYFFLNFVFLAWDVLVCFGHPYAGVRAFGGLGLRLLQNILLLHRHNTCFFAGQRLTRYSFSARVTLSVLHYYVDRTL